MNSLQGSMHRRPRVLFVVENNPYPQDFRVRREAVALQERGFKVSVLCPKAAGQAWAETVADVGVYRFPGPPAGTGIVGYLFEFGFSTLMICFYSIFLACKNGIDVLHAANPPDTLVVAALLLRPFGTRFVFDHHDLSPEIYLARGSHNKFVVRTLAWFERLSMTVADAVVSTNESYKSIAIKRGGKTAESIFVVRNGPPLSYVLLSPDPDIRSRAQQLIGYVGTIGPQDGLDHLVAVIDHMVKVLGRSGFVAIVVGDGDSLRSIKKLVSDLGLSSFFHFTGRLDETSTRRTLSSVDICVQPDPHGLLNDQSTMNKMMEYMALGKATVAFDLKETRYSAGDAARYAPPNDPTIFARHVCELLDQPDERKRMGAIGRDRIENSLAWDHSIPNLLACYAHVLNRAEINGWKPDQALSGRLNFEKH